MKRFLLFLSPIVLGIIVFSGFLFFLSKSTSGSGALQITSIPISTVYINGNPAGKTPLCKCEGKDMLPVGDYTIKLVPTAGQNVFPYEEHITITKGILTVVDRTFGAGNLSSGSVITLIPLSDKKSVSLSLSSFPSNAAVLIDGNTSGMTPLVIKSLTPSDHDVTLSKNGYTDKTIHIHTVLGYQLNALVSLSINPPNASNSAALPNVPLTTVVETKVTILDTPTGFLRVRAEPSLSASETAQVKPGDSFVYVDEQNGWYEITMPDKSTGWVSAQYAEKK